MIGGFTKISILKSMSSYDTDIIVIPDVHGRRFWRRAVDLYPDADTIFLGDYHDPYPAENISEADSMTNLIDLFNYVRSKENVHLLLGNHEMNYFADFEKRVRFDNRNADRIKRLLTDMMPRMAIATIRQVKNKTVFFSHAPVLKDWVDKVGIAEDISGLLDSLNGSLLNVDKSSVNILKLLNYVPSYRNGSASVGSPIWADARELINDGKKIVGSIDYSIFGHTMVKSPIITSGWADIDCQRAFRLTSDHELLEI